MQHAPHERAYGSVAPVPEQILLQPILIGVGLSMALLALMPSVRRFSASDEAG